MAKQSRDPKNPQRAKRDAELTECLTFLEKLVLRVLPGRQVPAESGVRFAIGSKAKDDGICLVFQVDDQHVPIVTTGPRPDYLVVHVSRSGCLMTIVEMKGTEKRNCEHGIEQILAFSRLLRDEMARCLPGSWRRVQIQGLLLTPFNSQIGFLSKKIDEARKQKVEILPLQYSHQAELYSYISKPISRTVRYAHEKLPRQPPELNVVEEIIASGKLDKRIRDTFFNNRPGADEDTFFLTFRRPGDSKDSHVSLSATVKDVMVKFSPATASCRNQVLRHLEKHGLQCSTLRVVDVPDTRDSISLSYEKP